MTEDTKTDLLTASQVSQTLDGLTSRKSDYLGIPQGVLDDLRGFCRADRSCFDIDPRIHAALEGRREVWLRIQQHLELTPEELLVFFSDGKLSPEQLKGTEYAR